MEETYKVLLEEFVDADLYIQSNGGAYVIGRLEEVGDHFISVETQEGMQFVNMSTIFRFSEKLKPHMIDEGMGNE